MRFGVIYSIDWNSSESEENPFEGYEEAADLLPLFHKTENTEFDPKGRKNQALHAKYASKELLTRKQFERFLSVTRMVSDPTPTRGSIIGYAWGMGWTAPAVRFFSDSKPWEEDAYVTPVPDFEPKWSLHDTERFYQVWERVRDAIVDFYEDNEG